MKRYFVYLVLAASLLISANSFAQDKKPAEKKASVSAVKDTASVKKSKRVKKAAKKAAKTEKKAEATK